MMALRVWFSPVVKGPELQPRMSAVLGLSNSSSPMHSLPAAVTFPSSTPGLGVDSAASAAAVAVGVLLPHLLNIRLEVAGEIGADSISVRRVQHAQDPAFFLHDELAPRLPVFLLLLAQVGSQLIDPVRRHARDVLLPTVGLSQADSDGQGGRHVDVADIGVQLRIVEGELRESKVDVCIRIAGVEDAGLDEGRSAWIEEEGEFLAAGDPDAAAGDLGDGDGDGVAWGAEGDGAVFGEGRAD
jgi:hypothetical protein